MAKWGKSQLGVCRFALSLLPFVFFGLRKIYLHIKRSRGAALEML